MLTRKIVGMCSLALITYTGMSPNTAYAQAMTKANENVIERPIDNTSWQLTPTEEATLWNLFPTFGYGSYQQGDTASGVVLTVLDGITWSSVLLGVSPLGLRWNFVLYFGLALVSFLSARIFGVIAPTVYAPPKNQNRQAKHDLETVHILDLNWSF